jgi:hypothetical protein
MSASASAAAASLKSQYAKTGPCGADTVAKYVGRAQPHAGKGMGFDAKQAAKCLDYWDHEAPSNDGPQTLKGY